MKASPEKTRPGRPRTFDEDAALEKAMEVFWRKGYDAASLSDLTSAMGLNPPSLYAAFGNKEALFLRVLARYGEGPASYSLKAAEAPTAREVVKRRLHGAVKAMFDSKWPPGCLAVQAASKCGDPESAIGQRLIAAFDRVHKTHADRFRKAHTEGDLPPDIDPDALARLMNAIAHGISVHAAAGVSRSKLKAMVDLALRLLAEPAR